MQHVDSGRCLCITDMQPSLKQSTFQTSAWKQKRRQVDIRALPECHWIFMAMQTQYNVTLALPPLLHCSVISNLIPYFYVCSFQIFIIFNLYSKSVHLPVWDKSDILFPSSSSIPVVLVICCTSHFPCCLTSDLLIWMHSKFEVNYEVIFFWLNLEPPPPFPFF